MSITGLKRVVCGAEDGCGVAGGSDELSVTSTLRGGGFDLDLEGVMSAGSGAADVPVAGDKRRASGEGAAVPVREASLDAVGPHAAASADDLERCG